jgi:hypothetical protein
MAMESATRLLTLLLAASPAAVPAQTNETVGAGTSPVIRGVGLKRTVYCSRARVTVDGSRNEIVMHGPCERVAVHGTDNRVAIEELGTLSVIGSGHQVQWVRGVDGKEPKISNDASGSAVLRISKEEFAKLPVPTSRE